MNLKTFRAATMAEALALVKRDLGKEAVILNTRSARTGGVLGFFSKAVVEVTASDQGALLARRPAPASRLAPSATATSRRDGAAQTATSAAVGSNRTTGVGVGGPGVVGQAITSPAASAFFNAPAQAFDPLTGIYPRPSGQRPASPSLQSAQAQPGQQLANANHASQSAVQNAGKSAAQIVTLPVRNSQSLPADRNLIRQQTPGSNKHHSPIEHELAAIKLMVSQVLQASATSVSLGAGARQTGWKSDGTSSPSGSRLPPSKMPEPLFDIYLQLLQAQMARSIVEEIVGAVRDELSPGELADESIVRTSVLRRLADLIPAGAVPPASRPLNLEGKSHARPHVIALIGPTGVGKTTTTAKLAAAFKLRHGRNVALITTDTYRIAAVDQLRTYANIIGIPLKVVMTPAEMITTLRELDQFDVVLIDTAGRSQHNADRLEELAGFLQAAQPDETHLVLSCASSEQVLLRTAQAFAAARPTRILFSKLDEAVSFGLIVNVMRGVSEVLGFTPVSYVTTGQEVPDHIEPGRPDRLARMVLDNCLEQASAMHRFGPQVATADHGDETQHALAHEVGA